jgi:hypothetical protein
MPQSLATALAALDDAAVCSRVFAALRAHYGETFDPATIPSEHRTVLLVWNSKEVIANNGFNGFFAVDQPGDQGYARFKAAYEAVGCEPALRAIRRVFDAFPNRIPPTDARVRVQAFGKANHAAHGALNRDFIKAQEELTASLAQYIRDRAKALASVVPVEKIVSENADIILDRIETQIADLPYWARVAFFARCARHVLPLWEESWPAAPPEYRAVIEQAIVLSETSAAEAKHAGDLKTAGVHTAKIPVAALAAQEGRETPDVPPAFPQRAALIAAAAGNVLDYIIGVDETGSYTFAKAVTEDAELDDLLNDIHEDFQRIEQLARECEWTDKSPIPPEVFDASFKPHDKKWWKVWGRSQ